MMGPLRERRYILIEAPDYIGSQTHPIADHCIAHVDFVHGWIEIGEAKFDLRAFLCTAENIARDKAAYHRFMGIRFTSGASGKWESFKIKAGEDYE